MNFVIRFQHLHIVYQDKSQVLRENLKACHTEKEECQQQLILMKEIVEKKQVILVCITFYNDWNL